MSDGISTSPSTPLTIPSLAFFEPLFRQLPGVKDMHKLSNLAEFMASDQISTHTDDDKTWSLSAGSELKAGLPGNPSMTQAYTHFREKHNPGKAASSGVRRGLDCSGET